MYKAIRSFYAPLQASLNHVHCFIEYGQVLDPVRDL